MFYCIRCAILLDELGITDADKDDFKSCRPNSNSGKSASTATAGVSADVDLLTGHGLDLSLTGGQVVVELKTSNALPLLKYACSNRIIALPTSQLNAQRVSGPSATAAFTYYLISCTSAVSACACNEHQVNE